MFPRGLRKGFTGTNSRRFTGQQPATKSARGPAVKPRVNRSSTGLFVPPPVYIGFPLFGLAKRHSEQLFLVPWRARGSVAFRADRDVGTLVCPSSPRPTVRCALRRPDLPVVCPGFGLDRFTDTYGRRYIFSHQKRRALLVHGINQ